MGLSVTREQVVKFRLANQHLAERLPADGLLAAAALGLQDTPPGSAALAAQARVAGLAPADFEAALNADKVLLRVWGARAAPFVVPTAEAAVFTLGLRPRSEAERLFFIKGAAGHLERFGLTATAVLEAVAEVLPAVLDGRALTKDELGAALARAVGPRLAPRQTGEWNAPDGLGQNRYGESLVRFALALAALEGLFCLGPRRGAATTFVRVDQWLGAPLPPVAPEAARAELLRRYLAGYGPSTPAHFAAWAGIAPEQAAAAWEQLDEQLVPVRFGRRLAWIRATDRPRLEAPPAPRGARWLPPHDPYLSLRDRATLLPETALQRRAWRTVGNPGLALVDGRAVGLWRLRQQGRRLTLTLEPIARLAKAARGALEKEAAALAEFRGCAAVEVRYAPEGG